MCDIKLEPEDLEICRGCLSSDRTLSSVETAVYLPLLTEDQILELDLKKHIALCWECMALLRKICGFRAQVQKAHMILKDSLQLLPTKPTLSSLSVHQNFEYDAVFEESTPHELPFFYELSSTVDHDKVIVPTKYKSMVTKTKISNMKHVKVVLHDIIKNNIKTEHPNDDSDDNENFGADDSYSSSEEITETKNDSREILSVVKQPNLQEGPKITKEINKTTATLKLGRKSQRLIDTKKIALKRRKVDTAQKLSVKTVKHNSIKHGKNKCEIKTLESLNIDNNTKLEVNEEDNIYSDDEDAKADLNQSEFETQARKEKQSGLHTDIKFKADNEQIKAERKRKKTSRFREIKMRYKKIEQVLPYFQEIEMNKQDLKITLEKDDAIVDKQKIHKCSICGVKYQLHIHLNGHALRNHRRTHPEHFDNTNFNNPALVLPQKSVWRCDVCARMMRREHVVAHMNEFHVRRFLCNGCDWSLKPFWKFADRQRHWNEIHRQLICSICKTRRISRKMMEFHIEETHVPPNKRRKHQCPHCPNTYRDRKSLYEHDRDAHQPPEQVELRYCVTCDITFKRICNFELHFRNFHSGIPKQTFPCPQCGKVLQKKANLKAHMSVIHAGITNYRCHICDKYLCTNTALRRHLDMHKNIKLPKNHACTICGRKFQTNSSLQFHMNTHTGERPYKCTECESAFTQPYTLQMHLAKRHNVDAGVKTDGTIVPATKTKTERND
ncbi:PR domain zinc finger protein 5-like [Cydia strobilella]|uniref:PR domain zinc finger protein 5-like n=1 Tax=Cydia strobilella TaxID=1100964 RepID=UPI003007E958